MKDNAKRALYAAVALFTLLILLLLGPCDFFSHGFYYDPVDYSTIFEEDKLGLIPLSEDYQTTFTPAEDHFTGFAIYFAEQPWDNTGSVVLKTYGPNGKQMDDVALSLTHFPQRAWYPVYTKGNYKKGVEYTLVFHLQDATKIPALEMVDNVYLPTESNGNNLLLSYAYGKPTFSVTEKAIITMVALIFLLFLFGEMFLRTERRRVRIASFLMLLITMATCNYNFNTLDNANTSFQDFQVFSETLVTGAIEAQNNGVSKTAPYGLGRYCVPVGIYNRYGKTFTTDDIWNDGYNRSTPQILIGANDYTVTVALVGNEIRFGNGDTFKITSVDSYEGSYVVTLNSAGPLSRGKHGSLFDIDFITPDGEVAPRGGLWLYTSQYGLQGNVCYWLAKIIGSDYLIILNFLCSFLTAAVFVLLAALLAKKYNYLLAACFYITFLLSPILVDFARNLYWVIFTWFTPMLIGLACSLWIDRKKVRIASYIAIYFAILIKCLCGYEFITVVMMASIMFLLVDFVLAAAKGKKDKAKLLFNTIFIIGLVSIAGFATAIGMHAYLRGDGSLLSGVLAIIREDVLRRTNGGTILLVGEAEQASINASVFDNLKRHFSFSGQIITGIDGNLFPLLTLIPLAIFVYDYRRKQLDMRVVLLYCMTFISCISWFVLGKSHSYEHPILDSSLWYMGYIQMCFYTIVDSILRFIKSTSKGQISVS